MNQKIGSELNFPNTPKIAKFISWYGLPYDFNSIVYQFLLRNKIKPDQLKKTYLKCLKETISELSQSSTKEILQRMLFLNYLTTESMGSRIEREIYSKRDTLVLPNTIGGIYEKERFDVFLKILPEYYRKTNPTKMFVLNNVLEYSGCKVLPGANFISSNPSNPNTPFFFVKTPQSLIPNATYNFYSLDQSKTIKYVINSLDDLTILATSTFLTVIKEHSRQQQIANSKDDSYIVNKLFEFVLEDMKESISKKSYEVTQSQLEYLEERNLTLEEIENYLSFENYIDDLEVTNSPILGLFSARKWLKTPGNVLPKTEIMEKHIKTLAGILFRELYPPVANISEYMEKIRTELEVYTGKSSLEEDEEEVVDPIGLWKYKIATIPFSEYYVVTSPPLRPSFDDDFLPSFVEDVALDFVRNNTPLTDISLTRGEIKLLIKELVSEFMSVVIGLTSYSFKNKKIKVKSSIKRNFKAKKQREKLLGLMIDFTPVPLIYVPDGWMNHIFDFARYEG